MVGFQLESLKNLILYPAHNHMLILMLKMETAEREETVAKIKDLIKYMGKEIVVDLSDV